MLMAKERELKEAVREGRDRVSEETGFLFRVLYFVFWWLAILFVFTL